MKRLSPLLVLIFSVLFFEAYSQSAVCNYKYRKRISFDPAKVSGPTDLTNFPTLISITSDNDLRTISNSGHVENASGYDIIFVAADGVTKLDHQMERYTATTGELSVWVRIPVLSTTYSTTIYMYYGNSSIGADQSVTSTWSSGYKAVWHFNNNNLIDVTGNGNNATNVGTNNLPTAKILGGRSCVGTGTNYIQAPLAGTSGGSGNGTVQFWGMLTSYTNSTYFFGMSTTQTATYTNRIQLYLGDAAGNLYLGMGGNHTLLTNAQTFALNTWYQVVLTWATSGVGVGSYSLYVNGVQKGTGAYSAFTAMHTFADIGNDGNASQRTEELPGNFDEFRVTNTTLSTDWILTEYNNQNTPSTFYSISAEPKVWNGITNNQTNTASNWLNNVTPGIGDDIVINNGTNQPTMLNSYQLTSMFIRTNATLSMGSQSLGIRSDITNCGTIAGNTGSVILNSTIVAVQNISGSGTYSLTNLTVNNTFSASPTVSLNRAVDVSGALLLSSGILYTSSSNLLTLGTAATSNAGSTTSFVSGPMTKTGTTDFVFPIGKGTRWRRAAVTGITASTTYQAEYFNTAYSNTVPVNAPLDNVSSVEYWQVDRTVGTGNAKLGLYWEDASTSGINNCADLTIARWNGTGWDERAATTSTSSSCSGTGTGIVTTTAVLTAFSPFTFGSKLAGVNPLPIELMNFEAICQAKQAVLKWQTASEKNNAFFEIERSINEAQWQKIGSMKGAGTNSTEHHYYFEDITAAETGVIYYYRLKQVDVNGESVYSPIVSLNCGSKTNNFEIYPNPTSNELRIKLNLSQEYEGGILTIVDNLGKTVFLKELTLHKGTNEFNLDLSLEPGVYTLMININNCNLEAKKLLIQK